MNPWRSLGLALLVVGLARSASAQQQAPIAYELRFYQPGGEASFATHQIPAEQTVCNLVEADTVPTGPDLTKNPEQISWDDPLHNGRVCLYRFDQPAPGPIASLPFGSYDATLVAVYPNGATPESNRASFSRVQAGVTGLRFSRSEP